jgi:hypothetical protein
MPNSRMEDEEKLAEDSQEIENSEQENVPEKATESESIKAYKEDKKEYKDMTVKDLKNLAKERDLTRYNNLKKDELVKLHEEFDEDLEFIIEDNEDEEVNDIEEIVIKNTENTSNFLKVFTFDGKQIRTAGTCEEPLFVVKDES